MSTVLNEYMMMTHIVTVFGFSLVLASFYTPKCIQNILSVQLSTCILAVDFISLSLNSARWRLFQTWSSSDSDGRKETRLRGRCTTTFVHPR